MNKELTKVTLSHKEMLDTMQTIHIYKQVSLHRKNNDEATWAATAIEELLDSLHTTSEYSTVKLNTQQRFAIWLALDIYKQFLIERGTQSELIECDILMLKFAG